jgi:archaellum component FlaC
MSDLILSDFAEQKTIASKRAELAELQIAIRQREAEFTGLQADFRTFESRYLQVVGQRYDELAEIEKQIAELQGLSPDEAFEEATSLADDEVGCGQNRFHSDKVRKLYREVCRKFHPDLSSNEQEREHRHQLMIEVNRAYEAGAEQRLQALLEAGTGLENLSDDSTVSTEMILLTRQVADAKNSLLAIEQEIAEMTSTETWRLKLRVEKADAIGVDLLADLVEQVDRQILKARNRLEALQGIMMTA